MAIFNEIQVGRFNRALQKMTGIKGGPVIPSLMSELNAVVPIFFGAENRYLESWFRFSALMDVTGGVGVQAGARIRIPGASNIVVVIEAIVSSFFVADSTAVRIDATGASADLATIVGATSIASLDGRANPSPNAILSTTTSQAAITSNYPVIIGPANSTNILTSTMNQEIPLIGTAATGGAQVTFRDGTIAARMLVGLIWRERLLEDSERN